MKTLSMLPLTLKKARTFDSISAIDSKVRQFTNFVTKLVDHNVTFLEDHSPKLVRQAETGLVRCEGLLGRFMEQLVPVSGRAYRPSGLEQQVIDELERSGGSWLASEEPLR